jgi:hypothetical protein
METQMPDHDPKWDKLAPGKDGNLRLLPPAAAMREIAYSVGVPGSDKDEYTYVFRMFNSYRWERVVARDQKGIVRSDATGNVRAAPAGREFRDTTSIRWAFVLFQKYELWRTDMVLDDYYNTVTGAKVGIPASAYGVGKTAVTAAKWSRVRGAQLARHVVRSTGLFARAAGVATTGAASTATTAAATPVGATVAVGLADAAAAFIVVTYVMAWAVPSSTKEADGWFPVGGDWDNFEFKPGDVQIRYDDKVVSRCSVWR